MHPDRAGRRPGYTRNVRAGKLVAALVASAGLLAASVGGIAAATSAHRVAGLMPVLGTEDYAPGPVRVSFLLLDSQGSPVYRKDIRVRVSAKKGAPPLAVTRASLEPIGVPGVDSDAGDITKLYVVHFRAPRAGTYTLTADATGGKPVRAGWTITVREHPRAPAVRSKAIPSQTPTTPTTHR